ncbi:TIGR04283 family arsenosugar biosynthesis glycosyltransferase [Alcanivorax sp. JB21]|uniref:TIGR04283 family arsenosugar biosynthesis glycosyltransferase n=1 Tax=Alcanivorax limicola TaxID=2874102 RepID=UPI001CBB2D00|nr:TIGR04283 family arsenosugar biosynthesis glycosyltransferase [Alcanivorax limicola]MBZ2188290.1 TIGR04283 family arsenosugar biosynthesis glycosyltransferase [Alcanivorax limicola]
MPGHSSTGSSETNAVDAHSPEPAGHSVRTPWLSVIVPVRNEAQRLGATLMPLQAWRARGVEVLVVDGGSDDGSPVHAMELADRVLHAAPGRALQMNRGAQAARGHWLWFLHADTGVTAQHLNALQTLPDDACWGFFRVRMSTPGVLLRCVAGLMNLRSRSTGVATGDQGIVVKRCVLHDTGGYPSLPLMEDVALSKLLRAQAVPRVLGPPLTVDSRRWEQQGVWRTIILMWWLRWRYWRGEDPHRLHALYYGRSASQRRRPHRDLTDD